MPSSGSTGMTCALQLGADLAEDVRDLRAEHRQDGDRDDGDQGEQERILDEGLALLALLELVDRLAEAGEGEIRPHRERTNGIHHFSSFWASAHAPPAVARHCSPAL